MLVDLGGRRLEAVNGQVEGTIYDSTLLMATMNARHSDKGAYKIRTLQLGDTAESAFAVTGASLTASLTINNVGSYRVELVDGNSKTPRTLCSLFERLHVDCNGEEGYVQDGSGCELRPSENEVMSRTH